MTFRSLPCSGIVLALSLGVAACGPTTGTHPASPGAKPAQVKPKAEGTAAPAVQLLWEGNATKADKLLRKILKKTPNDPLARKLMKQITDDPHKLLGTENYPYKVKPGETLWGLSQRVLGDPMMFYVLARYNDIAVPRALAAGSTIHIPGKLRTEPPPPPPKPAEKPAEKPLEKPTAAPTPPPAPPPVPARDPARATRLRAAGLAAMNKGAIDRAVWLLRQAQQADPSNALVTRDLERARKIQATVHSR